MKKYIFWLLSLSWAILIWRLTTTTQIIVSDNSWFQNLLMAVAHFIFFGLQAGLLRFAITKSYILNPDFLSLLLSSLYGAVIEFRQLTVPGRSADPLDWLLDTLGAIVFLVIIEKYSKNLGFRN